MGAEALMLRFGAQAEYASPNTGAAVHWLLFYGPPWPFQRATEGVSSGHLLTSVQATREELMMNATLFRSATLLALLLFCLPAIAQKTRFESQGEAFVAAEDQAMIETALVRHVFGAPPSGKGQIVFFRSARSTSTALEVRESGTELAKLSSGSYFVVAAQPGTYTFTVDAETGEALTVQVKPGRTHYVKASDRRADGQRPYLSRADAITFLGAVSGRRVSIL